MVVCGEGVGEREKGEKGPKRRTSEPTTTVLLDVVVERDIQKLRLLRTEGATKVSLMTTDSKIAELGRHVPLPSLSLCHSSAHTHTHRQPKKTAILPESQQRRRNLATNYYSFTGIPCIPS